MAEVAKSLDELWENKDYQKTGFFAIFWLSGPITAFPGRYSTILTYAAS